MIKVLGKPSDNDLEFITNEHALKFIKELPATPKRLATQGVKYENPLALELINKCLEFNPSNRLTIEQALAHPYFEGLHDANDEPCFTKDIDFEFESNEDITLNDLKAMIIEEINNVNSANGEDLYDVELIKKGFK